MEKETSSSKFFFILVGSVLFAILAFGGLVRKKNLEELFIYREDHRLATAKESLYNAECQEPRRQQEKLTMKIEEQQGSPAMRMKSIYIDGSREHELYPYGQKIIEGEKYVDKKCEDAIKQVANLKRGSSTEFVITNFFGRR